MSPDTATRPLGSKLAPVENRGIKQTLDIVQYILAEELMNDLCLLQKSSESFI